MNSVQYKKFVKVFFSLLLVAAIVAQPTISSMSASALKSSSYYSNQINNLKQEQEEINNKLDALEDSKAEQAAIQDELKKQITNTQSLISAYTEQINAYADEISQKAAEIDKKNSELDNTKYIFKQRLRSIYMSGGDITAISMLMNSDDFADLLSRAELTKSVSAYDHALMEKIVKTISEINQSKAEVESKKADKQKVLDEQNAQRTLLNSQFDKVSASIATISSQSSKLEQEQTQTDAELDKAQENYAAAKIAETPKVINSSGAGNIKYDGSQFTWPVPSCYTISSGYGPRSGGFHKGVDISNAVIYGQPVVAAADGVVINAFNGCTHDYPKTSQTYCHCGGGYGNNIIISHGTYNGNSYATLYGHLKSVAVSVGQTVKKGQVIGYVGTTGDSTGKHLHFEIRVNGSAVNPMNFFN